MNKVIEILVTPDGQASVLTRGFAGTECQQASQFIEKALGKRETEQLTPEYFQSSITSIEQQASTDAS